MDDQATNAQLPELKFTDFGLDVRLEKSIQQIGWSQPTLVQEKAIQLGLEGKDLLIKGRTGCGKTAAFLIPILHQVLQNKRSDRLAGIRALILSPSKELCRQTATICRSLNHFSAKDLTILDLSDELQHMRKLLLDKPDIVIATPSRLLSHHQNKALPDLDKFLKYLVIDEADLMFGFGYKDDMNAILQLLPSEKTCQTYLVSATLNMDIVNLKELFLHNPVIIKFRESETNEKVIHYYMYAEEIDKFLLINALFKFKLMSGRTIIFVNSVNRCYKLKLFLEQFGVRSVLLNSELPLVSRCHAIDQFNRGFYDIIIANDEKCLANPNKTKKRKFKIDNEFTVARGIDFQNVDNVINLDFPGTITSYIHRVGRTGRGPHEDTDGTVLSLISVQEKPNFLAVEETLGRTSNFKKFKFKMDELNSLKYRSQDAHRMITKIAINEARVKEIKRELLNSEKLKSYFQENYKDLKALKQDKELHVVKPVPHLKNIPDYIIPDSLQSLVKSDRPHKRWYEDDDAPLFSTPMSKRRKKHVGNFRHHGTGSSSNRSSKNRNSNPLRSFKVSKK